MRPAVDPAPAAFFAARASLPTKSPSLDSATTGSQAGGEGVAVEGELVAVERHAGLQPERVAGREAGGRQLAVVGDGNERLPERCGVVVGHEDLEAVLTGVPGAGQQQVLAGAADEEGDLDGGVVLEAGDESVLLGGDQAEQDFFRLRTLDGDQRGLGRGVVDDDVEAACLAGSGALGEGAATTLAFPALGTTRNVSLPASEGRR